MAGLGSGNGAGLRYCIVPCVIFKTWSLDNKIIRLICSTTSMIQWINLLGVLKEKGIMTLGVGPQFLHKFQS
jgi:hypothetical protein